MNYPQRGILNLPFSPVHDYQVIQNQQSPLHTCQSNLPIHKMSKTSVIVSNLTKQDFVSQNAKLAVSDQIKLAVLNLHNDEFPDLLPLITHWLNLPFLSRIVIILQSEEAASFVHDFLQKAVSGENDLKLPSTAKLLLQENLLQTSKLSDNLQDAKDLDVTHSLERFRSAHASGDYKEPEPQKSPKASPNYEALDLKKLGIELGDVPPTPPLERSRSVTRTLFKPSLKLNTSGTAPNDAPASPTITLDES